MCQLVSRFQVKQSHLNHFLSTIDLSEKMTNSPTEIANFKSKLEEFAIFAETVFQGNSESYKKELKSRVGHLFSKRIDTNSLDFRLEVPRKKPRKDVKINVPDEIWIKILGFMNQEDIFMNFARSSKHFNKLTLDHNINLCQVIN